MSKKGIRSESYFLFSLIKDILLLPFVIFLVIIKKKKPSDILALFGNIHTFFTEAKVTLWLMLINIFLFFLIRSLMAFGIISEGLFGSVFIWYPNFLFSFKMIPLFGSMFMHANLAHLSSNILALFIFGRVVEKHVGSLKMIFIYIGSGIISHILSSLINMFLLNVNIGALGASGAIMGLVSAAILFKPFYLSFNLLIPLPIIVLGWLAIIADFSGILSGANDGIGHFAHLGGFFAITLLLFFLDKKERDEIKKGFLINLVSFVFFIAVYFFFLKGSLPFLGQV